MKKVCFFVTSLNSGGIENYLLRFLNHYKNEINATVFCKSGVFGDLESEYRKIPDIHLIRSDISYWNLCNYFRVYKFIKNGNFRTVCDFTGNFAGIILLVSNLAGVSRRISFYRGSSNHFTETSLKLLYNKLVQTFVKINATKILSNSKTALDFFYPKRKNNDARFRVIYNGIDSNQFAQNSKKYTKAEFGIPENGYIIGHTGRFNSAKNHKTIIKVAEILCSKYNDIYFILCGKDTDVYLSETILNSNILKNNVRLLGYRNDIQNILPVFDLFFFPSITEGQPNSLIEAMIMGLPIVASNIDSIKETTPDFMHYKLKNPYDIKGFVSEIEIKYLSRDNSDQNSLSEWAIKNFNADKLFELFFKEL